MNKCTCGTKFTGGICSDWCDSLKPGEDYSDELVDEVLDFVQNSKNYPTKAQDNDVWVPIKPVQQKPIKAARIKFTDP